MPSPSDCLVVVTGASGFIAMHCIRQLLDHGYRVRGTVRSIDKVAALRRTLGRAASGTERLTFAVADLSGDAGWHEAMRGATYVLHTASPLPLRQPRNEDDLIVPARDGTLRVLDAAVTAGVHRVVQTSSIAAIFSGAPRTPGRVFTEEDWSDLSQSMLPYSRSKTLAERAAWAFVERLPREGRLELTTINPSIVLGPSLGGAANTSNELVRKLVHRELPGVPRLMFGLVDVRDVAAAHLLAMTSAHAPGERFIVSAGDYWYADVVRVLADAGVRVPARVLPDWLVRLVGAVNPTVRHVVPDLGVQRRLSSEKARRVLGWQARSVEETIVETARAMTKPPAS
jgi:nucleoside-diphosphate-sugar epimerase